MQRKFFILAMIALTLLSAAYFVPPLTGQRTDKIEHLNNPVVVTAWNEQGLLLADGTSLSIPDVNDLPANSAALQEAITRGVERDANGRLWALVQIHHGCGNDPIRKHIVRVDLSDFLTFLHVGSPTAPVHYPEYTSVRQQGDFGQFGWEIIEYMQYTLWRDTKNS